MNPIPFRSFLRNPILLVTTILKTLLELRKKIRPQKTCNTHKSAATFNRGFEKPSRKKKGPLIRKASTPMLRGGAATLNELEAATAHELLGLGPHRNGGRSSSRISESTAKQSFGSRNQSSGNEAWEFFLLTRVMVGSFLGWETTDVFSFLQLMENQFFLLFRSCCHLFRRCLNMNMKRLLFLDSVAQN